MLIKVITAIVIEVDNPTAAESVVTTLDNGLEYNLRDFPGGEIMAADVDRWEKVTDEEAEAEGWVE